MRGRKLYLLKLLHAGLTVALFFVFWVLFRYGRFGFAGPDRFRYNYYVAAMFGVMLAFLGKTYNMYLLGYHRIQTLVVSQMMAQVFSLTVCYVLTSLAWNKWLNPSYLILLVFIYGAMDCFWCVKCDRLFRRLNPLKKSVLIYRNDTDKQRVMDLKDKPFGAIYSIERCIKCGYRDYGLLLDRIQDYDAVFVAGVDSTTRNGIAKYCVESGIPGFFLPHIGDIIMRGAEHIQSFTSPLLYVNRAEPDTEYLVIKRLLDIFASTVGLILFSPVMIAVAIAIKVQDGGPVFYRQTRLTINNREFTMLKFRSMRVDAEADGVARLSTGENDERITKVGRFIRMCRLDELPQLFNILRGDMSVVGPRPERPDIADEYYITLPEFRLRLQVKAGLTGYAQVYGKYNTAPYEKLEFDLLYINSMSLFTDIRLVFATLAILFKKESTEGVAVKKKRRKKGKRVS